MSGRRADDRSRRPGPVLALAALGAAAIVVAVVAVTAARPVPPPEGPPSDHPWHTGIVATTFWVGEVFDPDAADGSQVLSTYDSLWMESYGGCDGVVVDGGCETEPRDERSDYFPTAMTPLENPFYVDVPYDDVNDPVGFAERGEHVPWADEPGYAHLVDDPRSSLLKNRWIMLHRAGAVCYAQIEDAGPGEYADAEYVFGRGDARPVNERYNGAGMDVSPAVNGCLGFSDLDGEDDRIDWRFVEDDEVPDGPWTRIVTTSGVR